MCPLVLGCRFRSWSPRSPCTCRQHQWCMRVHTTGTIMYTGDTTVLDTGGTTIMDTGDATIIGTTAGGDYRAPLGSGNTTMTMRKSPGVDRFL